MGLFDRFTKKSKEKENSVVKAKKEDNCTKEQVVKKTEIETNHIEENYRDLTVEYKDARILIRVRPFYLSQLSELSEKASDSEDLHQLILQTCVLNKYDNKPFTLDQVKQLFKGEIAEVLAKRCIDPDNIIVEKSSKDTENNNQRLTLNIDDLISNIETKNKKPLTVVEKVDLQIDLMEYLIKSLEEGSVKIREENMELTRRHMQIDKYTNLAFESLENGDVKYAMALFEENVNLKDIYETSYEYLANFYRLIGSFDDEIRICDEAIENLSSENRKEYFRIRKIDTTQREYKKGFFYSDENLSEIIKKEEEYHIKSQLFGRQIDYKENEEERNNITMAKKEYIEKNPTNFLIMGTKIYGKPWYLINREDEEMKKLRTVAGQGKYYEEKGEYEEAIKFYTEARKLDKSATYTGQSKVDKRIEICENKIKKQEIKDLEVKAKGLEKTDPKQAIEIYNELNILNPNLKKYDKRIDILNKKI